MREQKWQFIFWCTSLRSACNKRYSILHGTSFANSNLPINNQILMLYCYCMEMRSIQIEAIFLVSNYASAYWQSYFQDICAIYINEVAEDKIGGVGYTVEVNKTKILKRKNHQERLTTAETMDKWVFGGIWRETKQFFFSIVANRKEETLVELLLKKVHVKTTIISDCWCAYNNLSTFGYTYMTVNHSENFLSPNNPEVHIQTIERTWRSLKKNIPKSSQYCFWLSYIIVYSFKRHVGWYDHLVSARFELLLQLVVRFY